MWTVTKELGWLGTKQILETLRLFKNGTDSVPTLINPWLKPRSALLFFKSPVAPLDVSSKMLSISWKKSLTFHLNSIQFNSKTPYRRKLALTWPEFKINFSNSKIFGLKPCFHDCKSSVLHGSELDAQICNSEIVSKYIRIDENSY